MRVAAAVVGRAVAAVVVAVVQGHHNFAVVETELDSEPEGEVLLGHQSFGMGMVVEL